MTFNWVGGGTPPDFVYIWESCTASGLSYSPAPAPTADNGLGSPVVTQTSTMPPSTSRSSTGQLITYKFTGGTSQFQITRSPFASGQQGCSVRYTATISPLAVAIFSDRDESFRKGFDGNNNPVQISNLTDLISRRFGDTVINDNNRIWVGPSEGGDLNDPTNYKWFSQVQLTRELLGAWTNPLHIWSGDAGSYTDTFFTEYDSIGGYWDLNSYAYAALSANGPLVKKINLTVSNDGGNGPPVSATYELRIHHRYEFWQLDHNVPGVVYYPVGNFTVDNPGHALAGGGIGCQWSDYGPLWSGVTSALSATLPVIANAIKYPLYSALFAAAGVGFEHLGPKPNNGVAPWAWNWPGSYIDSGNWGSNQNYYRMEPSLEQGYKSYVMRADEYGFNGYLGTAYDYESKPDGSYRWTGNFYYNGAP